MGVLQYLLPPGQVAAAQHRVAHVHEAVQLAEVSESSFVAYWTKDGVCFSVGAENVNRWDFLRQVRDNLIDLTEHYY